jgi:microcystin-dependent protein
VLAKEGTMAEPYLGQLMYTGFGFPPHGWAQCNGQLLPISQNTALFALIGTFYGGNGQTTFALPDMRGRVPIHQGQGQGLSPYVIGQESGTEQVTLLTSEMPQHTHTLVASTNKAETSAPAAGSMLGRAVALTQLPLVYIPSASSTGSAVMNPASIGVAGGSFPFEVLQPVLTVNCNIALAGVFPARN